MNLLIRNNHGEHLWPKNLIDDYRHTGIPSRNITSSSQIKTFSLHLGEGASIFFRVSSLVGSFLR